MLRSGAPLPALLGNGATPDDVFAAVAAGLGATILLALGTLVALLVRARDDEPAPIYVRLAWAWLALATVLAVLVGPHLDPAAWLLLCPFLLAAGLSWRIHAAPRALPPRLALAALMLSPVILAAGSVFVHQSSQREAA